MLKKSENFIECDDVIIRIRASQQLPSKFRFNKVLQTYLVNVPSICQQVDRLATYRALPSVPICLVRIDLLSIYHACNFFKKLRTLICCSFSLEFKSSQPLVIFKAFWHIKPLKESPN